METNPPKRSESNHDAKKYTANVTRMKIGTSLAPSLTLPLRIVLTMKAENMLVRKRVVRANTLKSDLETASPARLMEIVPLLAPPCPT